jgi:RimJ/RimL family protein N-acetyltransferase
MPRDQPTIQTGRLILRPFRAADAPQVRRLAGARAIADTTANIPHPYPEGAAEEWIASHPPLFEARKLVTFAVTLKDNDELVGAISLMDISLQSERAEVGYWVGKPYWNRGICTEAAQEVLRYAFDDMHLQRVQGRYFRRNPASGRVMEKLGMREEGCLRSFEKKWDRFEDVVICGILRSEWRPAD